MTKQIACWLALFTILFARKVGVAQSSGEEKPATAQVTETQKKNVQEYVELLHADIRQQKDEIMGAVLALDAEQAKKFWPIYEEYSAELMRLNKLRTTNLLDYAQGYGQMTDAKADDLMQRDFEYQRKRSELLAKYYGKVKEVLGAVEAARFLQIENQLLLILDLQSASFLPIGQGS